MNKLIVTILLLAAVLSSSRAQILTEYEFVTVGNPGNSADDTGFGAVAYAYNIGKFEVSRGMIEQANAAGNLGITMEDMTSRGGNSANRAATGVSWNEAAKFVNFLNSSQGKQVAYNFDANGDFQIWGTGLYLGNNQFRHKDAYYFLPSLDEWYKAAYGSSSGNWYNYATGSDIAPAAVTSGTDPGTAVWKQTEAQGPADIKSAGGLSAFGTMAQGGNVWEWLEDANDRINDSSAENREVIGGSYFVGDGSDDLQSQYRVLRDYDINPDGQNFDIGFRVASVPEPSALSLLAVGLGVVLRRRRRTV